MAKTALIFGASGLVGAYLVNELIDNADYDKILLFNRKPLNYKSDKVVEYLCDLKNLDKEKEKIVGNEVFVCIGTTIKKAGTIDEMKAIDYGIPVNIAKIAKSNNIENFAYVSSIGADVHSRNYYLKIKGETEKEILNTNFKNTAIVRPSILLGDRKEFRLGEIVGKVFAIAFGFVLFGKAGKYKAIHARRVARAMIYVFKHKLDSKIYDSDVLRSIGK